MAVIDVEMHSEDTDYVVVFHGIKTEEQKNRIKDWVNTLRGVSTSLSEYIFVNDMDTDSYENENDDNVTGTNNVIPEGQYAGLTIDDAYNIYGHYSLAEILLNVRKMSKATDEEKDAIYEEAVKYAIPLIKDKEIEFEDFIGAYKPFLKNYTPGEGKQLEDWLKLPPAEQKIAYDEMTDKMIGRMYKSLENIKQTA